VPYSYYGICEKCGEMQPWGSPCPKCGGRVRPQEVNHPVTTMFQKSSIWKTQVQSQIATQPLQSSQNILNYRGKCIRAIMALKAGRAPKEGIRYLSVGLDETIQKLQSAFERVKSGEPEILWLIGDYGEGKSHLLRLVTALAEEHRFAWAFVVHDKDQNVGLHKPAWLFKRLLFELRWTNSMGLDEFIKQEEERISGLYRKLRPKYPNSWQERAEYQYDRGMRSDLPKRLCELSEGIRRKGYQGIAICIDEVENCCQLHWNQHLPAYETLIRLYEHLEGSVLLCLALTASGLESLKACWRSYNGREAESFLEEVSQDNITMPRWQENYALPLAERIYRLHAVAFDWQPTVTPQEVAERAAVQAKQTPSGKWRTFVQAVVNALEREHQKAVTYQPIATKPSEPVSVVPKTLPTQAVSVSSPKPSSSKIQPGDRVEIVRTHFRGFRGIVERVRDNELEIVLDGRTPIRIKLPLDAVKKLR